MITDIIFGFNLIYCQLSIPIPRSTSIHQPKTNRSIDKTYKISSNSLYLTAVIITVLSFLIFGHLVHYTDAQNKSTLQLSTNKKTYKPGETVVITEK
jgi:hypothetical protein